MEMSSKLCIHLRGNGTLSFKTVNIFVRGF